MNLQSTARHGSRPSGVPVATGDDVLLAVEDLSMAFAGLMALRDVSFEIRPREIVGLIGPNGAGKTTLLNCISRIYTPQSGRTMFAGEDLLSVPLHSTALKGIARTFQNLEVFASATCSRTSPSIACGSIAPRWCRSFSACQMPARHRPRRLRTQGA